MCVNRLQHLFVSLLTVVSVAACVSYAPAPLNPAAVVQAHDATAPEPAAVTAEVARIAPGEHWDGRAWDRLSLLAAALTVSPEIALARAKVDSMAAQARAARVRPGPTVGLTAEYASNAPEASPWLLGIAADLPIDAGVRRQTRIDRAALDVRIAAFDYLDTVWSVRVRIRRALAEALLGDREVTAARALVDTRRRETGAYEKQLAAGAVARTDVERARAAMASDVQRLSDAEARAAAARLQLAAATGVPTTALDDRSLVWPGVDAPVRRALPLPASCRDAVLLARPDVARSSRSYDQAEAALKAAVAAQFPSVSIGPGYTWERGLKKWPFALNLQLPPLDGNRAAIAAAQARRTESGKSLEATVAAAAGAIDLAASAYRAAWVQLERARQQQGIAARLAGQADRAIAEGAIDRVQWTAAQAGRQSARLDVLAAVRSVRAAESDLEDALRQPLDGPELAIGPEPSAVDTAQAKESPCAAPLP